MRTRSEEKRREIVRVAAKAFEELGYERTSMLTIAERFKGSKQTLYNYFPSKEDLLRAVLDFDVGEVAERALQEFGAEKNLRKALVRLGVAFLDGQHRRALVAQFLERLRRDSHDLTPLFLGPRSHRSPLTS